MAPWNQHRNSQSLIKQLVNQHSVFSKEKVISNRAAYLGETHQPVEGAIFDHELLNVGEALVEIPVLHEPLFRT
jgi:hypothetical protein